VNWNSSNMVQLHLRWRRFKYWTRYYAWSMHCPCRHPSRDHPNSILWL